MKLSIYLLSSILFQLTSAGTACLQNFNVVFGKDPVVDAKPARIPLEIGIPSDSDSMSSLS